MNQPVLRGLGLSRRAASLALGVALVSCFVILPVWAQEPYDGATTYTDDHGHLRLIPSPQRFDARASADPATGRMEVLAEIQPASPLAAAMVFTDYAFAGAEVSRRFENVLPGLYRAKFVISDIGVEQHPNDVPPAWHAGSSVRWGAGIGYALDNPYWGGTSSQFWQSRSWHSAELAFFDHYSEWNGDLTLRNRESLTLSIALFTEASADGFASARTRATARATEISLTRIGDLDEPS